MSFGYVLFAVGEEYQRMAYALALSIKLHQNVNISLITDDLDQPDIYDQVIKIPKGVDYFWHCSVYRSLIYDLSPYDYTVHIESDCLVLDDLTSWWQELNNSEHYLQFSSKIFDIFGNEVNFDNHPRHRFLIKQNNLPHDLRVCVYWFKKHNKTKYFFDRLKKIVANREMYLKKYDPIPDGLDSYVAMCASDLGIYDEIKSKTMSFTHGKPYLIGDWRNCNPVLTHTGEFFINGVKQKNIFHYVDQFNEHGHVDKIIKVLENARI